LLVPPSTIAQGLASLNSTEESMKFKLVIVGFLAVVAAPSAFAAKDNFDRIDLGPRWVMTQGALRIVNQELLGNNLSSQGYFTRSAKALAVSAKVTLNGLRDQAGIVTVGDSIAATNAMVKIQMQDETGMFEYGAFYLGLNGNGPFFKLTSPMASPATLTAWLNGSVATMTIQSVSGIQTYQYDYGKPLGTGGGLGTFGMASLDDYKSVLRVAAPQVKPVVITGSNAQDLSLMR